ncbi:alpha-hydroxy acid oxidase [Amycolatopsis pithecellobii]|uniref:Alpha-hydroxy-acid oxidizing enzyme n=1 Tax=Amycolatopsis pithecellobii TaxID=664692 RepID=A0A6N7YNY5_9PSEU|nr:alpha-hydroxy acid oxidase [Amycolatopsis pithecellobii]MTD53722.1 alpha-hydroxy-acid oxidizing enzyme [Amycolatopsis pithecellobii]
MDRDARARYRQLPRWSELAPLLQPKPLVLSGDRRRARRAATVRDFSAAAQRRVPRAVYDYVAGAAEDERSMWRARAVLESVEFVPRVLRDVSDVDPTVSLLGREASIPVVFAPTGFTRMMHHEGERAVARAAGAAGIPYALSTMGTTSIEAVAAEIPACRRWFQLYLWSDRARSRDLVRRARDHGYEALILTVDTPVAGSRLRDVRNGMTIPPSLGLSTIVDGARHPHWWFNLLTTPPLSFASLSGWRGTVADLANQLFDPSVTLDDLAWLRSEWDGKLIVKGIQSVDDAEAAVAAGADAVVVSNHGGRQLDRCATPLEALPSVAEAIGDRAELLVDGGFLSGSDVVAALCLGADAILVGRAYLYGLMAAGEPGVRRVADLLAKEIRVTMQLLGAATVKDLTPAMVRLPRMSERPGPVLPM